MPTAISLAGLTETEKKLARLHRYLTDLRPFWPRVARLHREWMIAQFETEGGFGGEEWAPLSDAYADWKTWKFPGKGILQATGDLRRAALAPKRLISPMAMTLTVQEDGAHHAPVLDYHQEGTDRMPARPLLFGDPLPVEARVQLDALAELYARELVVKLGLTGMTFDTSGA